LGFIYSGIQLCAETGNRGDDHPHRRSRCLRGIFSPTSGCIVAFLITLLINSVYQLLIAGHLVMSCNNAVFVELLDFLLSELAKNANISTTRTYIQCLGGITYVSTFNTNGLNAYFPNVYVKMSSAITD